ncbi:MAG: carboxypeptidase regulatory-like domain-containing protein, partial [Acidobacteria bacterium]|nr:carboxypeptidase regulatory-like domain-containing protein [Acidobacteriota bacterium]
MTKKFMFIVMILVSLSFAGSLFGQGTTARLTGVVRDTSDAVVPGATVTLTNESTGTSLNTISGNNGAFSFDLIQAGTYTVTVEKEGFKKVVSTKNAV